MIASLFTITAQTNLHPGSGDANYGIIDKLVQRDTLTNLPVINASSLKGAFLQHLDAQKGMTDEYVTEVFGRQVENRWKKPRIKDDPRDKGKMGNFVFMQANLLSIPVRSNHRAFFRVTGSRVLDELRQHLIDVEILKKDDPLAEALAKVTEESKKQNIVLEQNLNTHNVHLEDQKNTLLNMTTATGRGLDLLKQLLGDATIILPNQKFRYLTDNHHLPVIARNHLENGQSNNLWYEQVLPRQTRFAFTIMRPVALTYSSDFDARLTDQGLVQIGANASVGYGYCDIDNFKTS